MGNNSSTGGYLVENPAPAPLPMEGQDLSRFLQQLVVGITGLDGTFVRPRWQPTPPAQPDVSTDWCAIGIVLRTPDDNPVLWHDSTGNGQDMLMRHEELEILASFYGPNCQDFASQLRDGVYLGQNRENLLINDMGLVGVGEIQAVPELINQQWVNRCDVKVTIRRQIRRTYPVLNLLTASGTIETAVITETFQT